MGHGNASLWVLPSEILVFISPAGRGQNGLIPYLQTTTKQHDYVDAKLYAYLMYGIVGIAVEVQASPWSLTHFVCNSWRVITQVKKVISTVSVLGTLTLRLLCAASFSLRDGRSGKKKCPIKEIHTLNI
jgi:hypothetical protein